jgi:hypothetical protein
MNEDISSFSIKETPLDNSLIATKTIAFGGLTVGVLDCLAATINSGLRGVTFAQVWQYVASGLLGKDSYNYGGFSVMLGLLIHFFIAFSVTAIYCLASRRLSILIKRPILSGTFYGIGVYFVMSHIVSPLSQAAQIPFTLRGLVTGIFIHIFCVGMPIALIARQFAKNTFDK